MSPRVSVILPAYNAADCLAFALDSLLVQDLTDFEVLVVDDASQDQSIDIAASYAANDSRIRLLRRENNGGAAAARNLGFRAARGKWLALLDADDTFAPDRLVHLVNRAEKEEADIIADNLHFVAFPDGTSLGTALPASDPLFKVPLSAAKFVRGNLFLYRGFKLGYLKPLFRRRFVEHHGLLQNEALRIAEDYHFLLDALIRGGRCIVEPQAGYCYSHRPGSLSRSLTLEDLCQLSTANRLDLLRASPQGAADLRAALKKRQWSVDLNIRLMEFQEAVRRRRVWDAGSIFARNPDLTPYLAFYGFQSLRKRISGDRRLV
ncbi:glycosyltransferase family 2 protein [Pelagibius litoralis]|uniref:Glycosyltransferase family 2 protein n=1 Tax=Pelagibius litoralis TaxID=374515 RepID=A0A967EUS9_9PROT|nr:glycosyltransferase [Pelagibius litoralis]NIA67641.1 glycosyltransferase family 2 protein [Pelagibius litoralis]